MNFITLAVSDSTAIYKLISIFGYSLAAVCLVLSIAVFFLYDIRKAYEFLTGRKQQKGISAMRDQQGDEKAAKPASPSMKFGFTAPPKSTEIKQKPPVVAPPPAQPAPQPVQPPQNPIGNTTPLDYGSGASAEAGTDVLSPTADIPAPSGEGGTEVLSPTADIPAASGEGGTEVLAPSYVDAAPAADSNAAAKKNSAYGSFILVKNEMLIHTDEVL